eukprot:CAMPEP_0174857238 /NCGR_PEP_ID=MMETSP1114-20130205/38114_1 /TAXON_ID=312471 /ORGANISM="Neobodo designis, Strain CCAP 1951/1" /LENGTH=91 /DNA_ID=CAMNT_0016092075 /DNA_START=161 /DNA_END=432 /DNA_ORIENTATION=-
MFDAHCVFAIGIASRLAGQPTRASTRTPVEQAMEAAATTSGGPLTSPAARRCTKNPDPPPPRPLSVQHMASPALSSLKGALLHSQYRGRPA